MNIDYLQKVKIEPAHSVSMDSDKGGDFEAQWPNLFLSWITNTKSFTIEAKFTRLRPDSIPNFDARGQYYLEVKEKCI